MAGEPAQAQQAELQARQEFESAEYCSPNEDIASALDCLGLLQTAKHSKNVDHEKCVEGLLGFESSVGLVHKLVTFVKKAVEVRRRNRPDSRIVPLVKELLENKEQLVNAKYDPFGITVPESSGSLSEEEFKRRYS